MKALALQFSTLLLALALAETAPGALARAESSAKPTTPTVSTAYPTFCSIPYAPKGLRSAAQFRAAVLDARRTGRDLVRASGPESFSLPSSGVDRFAADLRAQAAPPPPINPQSAGEVEAFAREAREQASPPQRPH